jgi:hypothetical protein
MTFKSTKVDVEDRSSGLRKAFHREAPTIGGNNLFTGEYSGNLTLFGMTSSSKLDWETFWTQIAGEKPPGPLPRGATAIMIAEDAKGDPVSLQPASIVREGGDVTVNWNRVHAAPGASGKSSYAILLVPKASITSIYTDVQPKPAQPAVKPKP